VLRARTALAALTAAHVAAFALAACSGARVASRADSERLLACLDTGRDAQACAAYEAQPLVCPESLGEIPEGELCAAHQTNSLECVYGERVCRCEGSGYCGGAPPPPELEAPRWRCRSPRLPEQCPRDLDEIGGACAPEGASCAFTRGCTSASCTCEGGAWRCTTEQSYPP